MGSIDGNMDALFTNLLLNVHDEPQPTPLTFTPHNWLKNAKIYNQKLEQVPSEWIVENADVIVLLFSAKGADRNGIIEMFQSTYENIKYVNLPVEVLNIPLDETAEDAAESFDHQANWFTLLFDDPLVHELKFMYGISCVPYIYVIKPTCEVVSNNGIVDLDQYGKNAIVSWMSVSPLATHARKMSKDINYYGGTWKYLGAIRKHDYHRKFVAGESEGHQDTTTDGTAESTVNSGIDATQEVTQVTQVTQDVTHFTQEVTQVTDAATQEPPRNASTTSEERMKDLHYSC